MDTNPDFGLPSEASVFDEIAKSEQKISVSTAIRRYGKKVTVVSGFDKSFDVKGTAKKLKEELACGGTVKDNEIELQGDHKARIKPILEKIGFPEETIVVR